jgi:hypothetical protein
LALCYDSDLRALVTDGSGKLGSAELVIGSSLVVDGGRLLQSGPIVNS